MHCHSTYYQDLEKFRELIYQDMLLIRSERTLSLCIGRNQLQKINKFFGFGAANLAR